MNSDVYIVWKDDLYLMKDKDPHADKNKFKCFPSEDEAMTYSINQINLKLENGEFDDWWKENTSGLYRKSFIRSIFKILYYNINK